MLRLLLNRRVLRLLRAVWRYRGRLDDHGGRYQREVATTVHSFVRRRWLGRGAFALYRIAMRALLVLAIGLILLAAVGAVLLYRQQPQDALLALAPLAAGVWLGWMRMVWGGPLDWLREHADPEVDIPLGELPARLRALAAETRELGDVPGQLGAELDQLATEAEQSSAGRRRRAR